MAAAKWRTLLDGNHWQRACRRACAVAVEHKADKALGTRQVTTGSYGISRDALPTSIDVGMVPLPGNFNVAIDGFDRTQSRA
jgi:hypothetical protein